MFERKKEYLKISFIAFIHFHVVRLRDLFKKEDASVSV